MPVDLLLEYELADFLVSSVRLLPSKPVDLILEYEPVDLLDFSVRLLPSNLSIYSLSMNQSIFVICAAPSLTSTAPPPV